MKRFKAVRMPPFGPRLYLTNNDQRMSFLQSDETNNLYTLLHDLMIINRIAYVDVGFEGDVCNSRVKIEDVWW